MQRMLPVYKPEMGLPFPQTAFCLIAIVRIGPSLRFRDLGRSSRKGMHPRRGKASLSITARAAESLFPRRSPCPTGCLTIFHSQRATFRVLNAQDPFLRSRPQTGTTEIMKRRIAQGITRARNRWEFKPECGKAPAMEPFVPERLNVRCRKPTTMPQT